MQLEYTFLAKFADTTAGGGFSAYEGGIAVIGGPALPISVPLLHLVAHFRFTRQECGQQYDVRVDLLSPSGEPLALGNTVLRFVPQVRAEAPYLETVTGTGVLAMLGVTFDQPGDYVFRLWLGEESLGGRSVHVHVTSP